VLTAPGLDLLRRFGEAAAFRGRLHRAALLGVGLSIRDRPVRRWGEYTIREDIMTQLHAADLDLLAPCFRDTGAVLAAVPADRWDAPTPCTEWTVRDVADHLVGALGAMAATVSGEAPDRPAGLRTAYDDATRRCLAAFARPGALAAEYPFLDDGTVPGHVVATISLSEALVHGWDLATAADLPYAPSPDAVTVLHAFAEGPKRPDFFADPVPVPADAPPLVALLGKLGRVA
jgi:uncharacterized protein (TIGR03086 family)